MKRKIKTVLVLIGAISMAFLPCMTAAPKADSRFTVLYNQEQMELPEDALITRNHVIMVSVADLAEKLGAGVYHDNQDAYAIQYQGKIVFVKKISQRSMWHLNRIQNSERPVKCRFLHQLQMES